MDIRLQNIYQKQKCQISQGGFTNFVIYEQNFKIKMNK